MIIPGRDAFEATLPVSRETMERLQIYADLLVRWTPKINLVSKSTLPSLWARHFMDSAQIFALSDQRTHWADFGSGGGFPGAVVAIMSMDTNPNMKTTLVEADQRKAAFLRTVARETGAAFAVASARIESLDPLNATTISARALAPLPKLLDLVQPHLSSDGVCVFLKGENAEAEVEQALESWAFHCEKHPSIVDSDATILTLKDIRRV